VDHSSGVSELDKSRERSRSKKVKEAQMHANEKVAGWETQARKAETAEKVVRNHDARARQALASTSEGCSKGCGSSWRT